jgi:hypothetical protein
MAVTAIDKIDADKLQKLMRMKPRLEDAAVVMGCSGKTIERFIRQEYNLSFSEFRDLHMAHCRFELVRTAYELATVDKNVVALLFCLKNMCDWKNDGGDIRGPEADEKPSVVMSEETALKLVKAARGNK